MELVLLLIVQLQILSSGLVCDLILKVVDFGFAVEYVIGFSVLNLMVVLVSV